MAAPEDIWLPLVDEPIGSIVNEIQAGDPEIDRLVNSPHRILAFKTFAYLRAGLLLGELLVEEEGPPASQESWIADLLRKPEHHARLVAEVRKVAEEIVAMLVGSIGLIAAVPLTTALAALLATRLDPRELPAEHPHAH